MPSNQRVNSGHVLEAVKQLEESTRSKLTDLQDEVASIQCAVDSVYLKEASMPQELSLDELKEFLPQIKQAFTQQAPSVDIEAQLDKCLDKKMDAVVERVMAAQEANKSFWTSPVFLGCVAGGALLLIGGTLYYVNQRVTALEELAVK